LPFNFFSTLDFSMGMIIGFYAPVQRRWRNWDCRSQFFSQALNLVGYSKFFDKPWEYDTKVFAATLLQITFTTAGAKNAYDTCQRQWAAIEASSNPWPDNFGLNDTEEASYADYWSRPMVSASNEPVGTAADVIAVLAFLSALGRTRINLESHYYYFFAGTAIGSAAGHALTFADSKFSLGIITPQDPWERYN